MSSPIDGAATRAAELVREGGGSLSVDLASTSVIERFGAARLREKLAVLAPDVVFANEEEAGMVGSEALPEATWAIKRGAAGCAILQGDERQEFPAAPAIVVDTTGAGDAFAAGYLVGGVELALESAALAVAKLGATP
jgi:sugar/nucleoside kinase (ribokinase family)